jgi:hypothetical protein
LVPFTYRLELESVRLAVVMICKLLEQLPVIIEEVLKDL